MANESLHDPALWRKLEERSVPEPNSGCRLWRLALFPTGYGAMRIRGTTFYAHRLAWVAHSGPIPAGMDICHKCDVRACINPNHLFLGSRADNMRDAVAKGRQAHGVRSGRAKLREADVRAIRIMAKTRTQTAIAEQFGVASTTVTLILSGRNWRHLV